MSVYITVVMKSSHEIRALVMIGFMVFFVWFCFLKKEREGKKCRLHPQGCIIQMLWDLERLYPLMHEKWRCEYWTTSRSRMRTRALTSHPLVQQWYCKSLCTLNDSLHWLCYTKKTEWFFSYPISLPWAVVSIYMLRQTLNSDSNKCWS